MPSTLPLPTMRVGLTKKCNWSPSSSASAATISSCGRACPLACGGRRCAPRCTQAVRSARYVDGRVTATDDGHSSCRRVRGVAHGHVAQEVDAGHDAVLVLAGDAQAAAARAPMAQDDGHGAPAQSSSSSRVRSRPNSWFRRISTPAPLKVLDLFVQNGPGQAVVRNADGHHTPGHRQLLEDGHAVAHLDQPEPGGQSGRPGADHGHLSCCEAAPVWAAPGLPGSWSAMNRFTMRMEIGSSTSPRRHLVLAEGRADPAADQGEGVAFPVDLQGLGIPTLGHQG